MLRPKIYCVSCGEHMPYKIYSNRETITVNDITFSYNELSAKCNKCGKNIYIPAINDINVEERHKAYYEKAKEVIYDKGEDNL